ncbi:hypothetical protein HDE_07599 [Halotydeus destructor]|nr:hypothetical protein HDE_07599 [Halotydeus destructor]
MAGGRRKARFRLSSCKMADSISVHSRLRAIWICLCLSGNTYQIFSLSNAYFSYDVATTVRINFPDNFEPPANTLCFALINMVRMELVMKRWPDFKARFGKEIKGAANMSDSRFKATMAKMPVGKKIQLSKYLYEGIKVEDAFSLTYGHEELFYYCRIIQIPGYVHSMNTCDKVYNVTESFMGVGKCFTFIHKVPLVYNYITVQRMKNYPGVTDIIVMKNYLRNVTTDLQFFTHPSQTYAREGLSRYLYLTPLGLFSVTHSTFTNKLLPAPYDTDCQNYTLSGYFDRGDCYETCVNKLSLKRLGKLAPGPVILLDEFRNEHLIDPSTVITNETIGLSIIKINDDCEKYCSKPDCENTYYVPSMMASMDYENPLITSYVEQQPVINTVYEQKQDFIQYFTDLFSTFGFWIGVSGLTMFDFVWDVMSRRKKSKNITDFTAIQSAAIQNLRTEVYLIKKSLSKTKSNHDSSPKYYRDSLSSSCDSKKPIQLEPMFRANFFKL